MRNCLNCQTPFIPKKQRPNQKYCQRKCYMRQWTRKSRCWKPAEPRKCAVCLKLFTPHHAHPHAACCSLKCGKRKHYLEHKQRYIERFRKWKDRNPSKGYEFSKRWADKNRDRVRLWKRINVQKRRQRIKQAGGDPLTLSQWENLVEAQRGMCWWCCGVLPLEIDHIFPISKGGQHTLSNVVASCKRCNTRKGNSFWATTKGLFFQLNGGIGGCDSFR